MKTNRFISTASILLAMALTFSCSVLDDAKKKTDELKGAFSGGYLQNAKGNFAAGSIADDADDGEQFITNLDINGSVLNGGSTSITVTSTKKLEEVLIQIKGEEGYYRFPLTNDNWINKDEDDATEYIYWVVLEFDQDLGDEDSLEFIVSGKAAGTGEISQPKKGEVPIEEAKGGAMQISVSWDRDDDVDLHVFSPAGDHIYYGDRRTGKEDGELDIDSNADCTIDGINSENIFFKKDPVADGDYEVEVRMFKKCGTNDGKSGARYNVTLNIGGKFYTFAEGKQTGKFEKEDSNDKVHKIGTIKIKDGKCEGCKLNN
ncbi:MAG: hypothetical protein LBH25_03135 [Fibromonadaceae bacterium]|jgi:hypothetical protein|nr:hypothetical protein [Fibromonadaceae bacterium]